jgi:hypothetical protein
MYGDIMRNISVNELGPGRPFSSPRSGAFTLRHSGGTMGRKSAKVSPFAAVADEDTAALLVAELALVKRLRWQLLWAPHVRERLAARSWRSDRDRSMSD